MQLLGPKDDAFWKHETSEVLDAFMNDQSIAGS